MDVDFTLSVDGNDAEEQLGEYFQKVEDHYNKGARYKDLLEELKLKLELLHTRYFTSQSGPGGAKWPNLEPETIKKKGHGIILYETGRLRDSLEGTTGDSIREIVDEGLNHSLTFGTAVPYSIFLTEGIKTKSGTKRWKHVGATEEDLRSIEQDIGDRTVSIILEAMP